MNTEATISLPKISDKDSMSIFSLANNLFRVHAKCLENFLRCMSCDQNVCSFERSLNWAYSIDSIEKVLQATNRRAADVSSFTNLKTKHSFYLKSASWLTIVKLECALCFGHLSSFCLLCNVDEGAIITSK